IEPRPGVVVPPESDDKRRDALKEELQVIKASFRVFILFLISWAPVAVLILVHPGSGVSRGVYIYAGLMAHANSTLNFLIYFLANDTFRGALYHFLRQPFKVLDGLCFLLKK
uniref:G-protein coupled receptors family 1 profile domain-containing protein n=1 Tax=Romanomermis culicivorax TaxID=13658 RepID=A0A915KDY9_ROMCU